MRQYYLQNLERGFVGNFPLFWKKGNRGYTTNLDEAQKFREDDALKMVADDGKKWKAWPCRLIDDYACRAFDCQNFRKVEKRMEIINQ
jgi:hypothetical protein